MLAVKYQMNLMNLTENEAQELKQNPPGTVPTTPEQFQLRLKIAKTMCKYFNEEDPTMTEEVRAVYEKYPMWGFYVDENGSCPRRSYGVGFIEKGSEEVEGLHMVTAHLFFINDVIGGVEASTVRRVDEWDEASRNIINMCNMPGMFLDPLGFLLPLSQNTR